MKLTHWLCLGPEHNTTTAKKREKIRIYRLAWIIKQGAERKVGTVTVSCAWESGWQVEGRAGRTYGEAANSPQCHRRERETEANDSWQQSLLATCMVDETWSGAALIVKSWLDKAVNPSLMNAVNIQHHDQYNNILAMTGNMDIPCFKHGMSFHSKDWLSVSLWVSCTCKIHMRPLWAKVSPEGRECVHCEPYLEMNCLSTQQQCEPTQCNTIQQSCWLIFHV